MRLLALVVVVAVATAAAPAAAQNCNVGIRCGNTCISREDTCSVGSRGGGSSDDTATTVAVLVGAGVALVLVVALPLLASWLVLQQQRGGSDVEQMAKANSEREAEVQRQWEADKAAREADREARESARGRVGDADDVDGARGITDRSPSTDEWTAFETCLFHRLCIDGRYDCRTATEKAFLAAADYGVWLETSGCGSN